jgi:hypothetical protein
MLPATSAAVRPAKLPGTQYLFYLVEREVVVPNGLRYIGLSVQAESRSLLAESEKEPEGQHSQAGLAISIGFLHYSSMSEDPARPSTPAVLAGSVLIQGYRLKGTIQDDN